MRLALAGVLYYGMPLLGLGINSHGNQLRAAPGILNGFDGVFCRESPHNQRQFTVACGLDGGQINPLHVFRDMSPAATVHFHNKFYVFHGFSLRRGTPHRYVIAFPEIHPLDIGRS